VWQCWMRDQESRHEAGVLPLYISQSNSSYLPRACLLAPSVVSHASILQYYRVSDISNAVSTLVIDEGSNVGLLPEALLSEQRKWLVLRR
jgi:hypothetical protein